MGRESVMAIAVVAPTGDAGREGLMQFRHGMSLANVPGTRHS